MATHFCTLFDMRYALRGLAMLESLETQFAGEKTVTILAMDTTPAMVRQMGRPDWKVITVEELGDAELREIKRTRPHREFCWTCAPALVARMVDIRGEDDVVVYVDADLYFFASPQLLLDELRDGGNILIHEHRYSADRRHYHAFRTVAVAVNLVGNVATIRAWGYEFSKDAQKILFIHYLRLLRRISQKAAALGFRVDGDLEHPFRHALRAGVAARQSDLFDLIAACRPRLGLERQET
jgi:hypothetical protein